MDCDIHLLAHAKKRTLKKGLMIASLLLTALSNLGFASSLQGLQMQPNLIKWQDSEGWMQVQNAFTYETLCEGFITQCTVAEGIYHLIDHSHGKRREFLQILNSPDNLGPNFNPDMNPDLSSDVLANMTAADVGDTASVSTEALILWPTPTDWIQEQATNKTVEPTSKKSTEILPPPPVGTAPQLNDYTAACKAPYQQIDFNTAGSDRFYIDLNSRPDSSGAYTMRNRYLKTGANREELLRTIPSTNNFHPKLNLSAINEAIREAHRMGGGTVHLPAGRLTTEKAIHLLDNVILDGAGIDATFITIKNGPHLSAIIGKSIENAVIQNININGNNEGNYGVRLEDTRNILVQCIEATNFDNSVLSLPFSQQITIRFSILDSGRDHQGNNKYRVQHGIDTKGCGGLGSCPASERFSIRYGSDFAIYSNIIKNNDGYGINSHASNSEIMGNVIDNNRWGVKLPQAMNVLLHHNQVSGVVSPDAEWGATHALRLYDANDFSLGAARPNDDIFIFENRFSDNSDSPVRFDGIHGDAWLINNTYNNTTVFVSESFGSDPYTFQGSVRHCRNTEDADVTRKITNNALEANAQLWKQETNDGICALDCEAIVNTLNTDSDYILLWNDNVSYPLSSDLSCY